MLALSLEYKPRQNLISEFSLEENSSHTFWYSKLYIFVYSFICYSRIVIMVIFLAQAL